MPLYMQDFSIFPFRDKSVCYLNTSKSFFLEIKSRKIFLCVFVVNTRKCRNRLLLVLILLSFSPYIVSETLLYTA